MQKARRYNGGKIAYNLIPSRPLKHLAEVYTKGAHKYTIYKDKEGNLVNGNSISVEDAAKLEIVESGANNWRSGLSWMETIAAVKRHIARWEDGEDIDKELQTMHLSNAAWGLFSLMEYSYTHPELDDRNMWYKKPFKRLYLDIDGVLGNFNDAVFKFTNTKPFKVTDFYQPNFMALFKDIWENEEFWMSIKPLISPEDIAYPITGYCTARSIPVEITKRWLDANGFPEGHLISVGYDQSKVQALLEANCELMIDDSIKNFVELNSAGINCYLMTQDHNRKYDVSYRRIDDLKEFLKNYGK